MSKITCPFCGGTVEMASCCPKSIACPKCNAAAGSRCRRPSGHQTDVFHMERVNEAERRDQARGLPT
jgi:hypothetical protein